ncbi:unnamed protein product [Rotaria sordida]|uniref:Phosphatidate phosphatase APP1 catalytic domain-containing protein n=1 Tax=Rotaria sordida TaxID=392033 RepID=A0A814W8F9_9BILA|nr:unnamed protein product [Rotaria sordida]
MISYKRKYVSALVLAQDYMTQWSADNVYADEALIVPVPSLAVFDPNKNIWCIQIKAWLYLPFEEKKIKNYLSSLTTILTGKTEENVENSIHQDDKNINTEKTLKALVFVVDYKNIIKQEELVDDDIYEDALHDFDKSKGKPCRLSLFFAGRPVKAAIKCLIHDVEHLMESSDERGFIEERLELSDEKIQKISKKIHPDSDDRQFDYEIRINESKTDSKSGNLKTLKCTIYTLAPNGVSIISDIDDTIKITKVLNIPALLKHTFFDDFKPVNGMNELYQKWYEQKCQFHYVSASPWQLFQAISHFLKKYNYPMGTVNLRKYETLLKFLKLPHTYKKDIITQIIRAYPFRKYICVGDSGELDPEMYAELYDTFPQCIAHIFIRDACQTSECLPKCQERYMKTFQDVPKQKWTVFKDPKTIETNVQKIIAT